MVEAFSCQNHDGGFTWANQQYSLTTKGFLMNMPTYVRGWHSQIEGKVKPRTLQNVMELANSLLKLMNARQNSAMLFFCVSIFCIGLIGSWFLQKVFTSHHLTKAKS